VLKVKLEQARIELARNQELYRTGVIDQQTLESSKKTMSKFWKRN